MLTNSRALAEHRRRGPRLELDQRTFSKPVQLGVSPIEPCHVYPAVDRRILLPEGAERDFEPLERADHVTMMRERSRICKLFQIFFLDHLALAAFRALAVLSAADNFAARAFPPFIPPSRPRATAAAFFAFFAMPDRCHKGWLRESR